MIRILASLERAFAISTSCCCATESVLIGFETSMFLLRGLDQLFRLFVISFQL